MAEQTTASGDGDLQPETEPGAQLSGQPSAADFVTPGMAGTGYLAAPPGQFAAPPQPDDGQVADASGQATGPARSRRRKVIVIASAAAVLLIGGGVALGVTLSSSGSQPLPGTLLGLARDDSADAQQATGQIVSEFGVLQGLIIHPRAAIYGTPVDGVLVLTAQYSDAAISDGFVGKSSTATMGGLSSQGVKDATLFPAGAHGGSVACGHKALEGESGFVCAWADGKSFGVTFYFGSASSLSDAATKTLEVRSAVEQ